MPVKKKINPKAITKEWLRDIKLYNKQKLDEILANPDYQEILGRKYYGDNWIATLYGNHPERVERTKETYERAVRRMNGEAIPYKLGFNKLPIIQMDMNEKFIKEWEGGAVEFCLNNGQTTRHAQTVASAARGQLNSAYGFKWKFKHEV
jgi:hypothetical protein